VEVAAMDWPTSKTSGGGVDALVGLGGVELFLG
jgi:hypothetical protein